jgi:Fic family protein
MRDYNWQQSDWPHFRYDLSAVHESLVVVAEKMGLIRGKSEHLAKNLQIEMIVDLTVEEAVKTSAIEGEYISRLDIRSSIKNQLGLNPQAISVHDKRATGIAELMLDVRNTFNHTLTEEKLFDWHLMLMSGSPDPSLKIGRWRAGEEPMQIVSGYQGREMVHYEAPPAKQVPDEMKRFIRWFNETAPGKPKAIKFAPVRAAVAHLYFESIHPFEDGNGRIGRAIAEKALSQGSGYPVMLSLSSAIEAEKKSYYDALKENSKTNDITGWIIYFAKLVLTAQLEFEKQVNFVIRKANYFDKFKDHLNERQSKVIKRMMRAGPKGFEGGMSAKKYSAMTGVSKATATRDLQNLLTLKAFKQIGNGRNIRYELNLE